MKITYELDSENPDHRADIEAMHRARDYRSSLWDIDQIIRSWQKHGDDGKYETAAGILNEIRGIISDTGVHNV